MALKVCFIDPPVSIADLVGKTKSMRSVVNVIPSLGLAYLASVVEKNGYPVRIIDCSIGISHADLIKSVVEFKPDVIGMTSTTISFESAKRVAKDIKQYLAKAVVILGGAHISAIAEEAMQFPYFDIGILGEGEITLSEVLKNIGQPGQSGLSGIDGIIFRENGNLFKTRPREFIKDLDSLPFPARHLLPPLSAYSPTPASYRNLPLGVLITSRGCPSGCTFCDRSVFGSRYRERSPKNIFAEIEELIYKFGAREIRFFDDTFTLNKQRVLDICALFKDKRIRISWTCLTKVHNIDEDLLKIMKDAGCWQILYGLESGDDRMLKLLKKGNTVKDNERAVRLAHKAGLSVRADFIVGTPGETLDSLKRTLEFAIKVRVDYAHFNKFIPFPGTELYDSLLKQGYKFDFSKNSSILDHSALLFIPNSISRDEFKNFLDYANKAFYLRPSYILKRLISIRTISELKGQIKGFFAIFNL